MAFRPPCVGAKWTKALAVAPKGAIWFSGATLLPSAIGEAPGALGSCLPFSATCFSDRKQPVVSYHNWELRKNVKRFSAGGSVWLGFSSGEG